MNVTIRKIKDTLFNPNPNIDHQIDREVRLEVDHEVWLPVWLNVSDQKTSSVTKYIRCDGATYVEFGKWTLKIYAEE